MRLVAVAKGGYYPAPPAAVAFGASLLRPPPDKPFTIFDPCCGEGRALAQLRDALGCAPERCYAVELSETRGPVAREVLAGSPVQTPASFLGVACSPHTMSLGWLNPPFDNEIGGGNRVEFTFLTRASAWIKAKGILLLVLPEPTLAMGALRDYFLGHYDQISLNPFPDGARPYSEVILAGRKLAQPRSVKDLSWAQDVARHPLVYDLPPADGPRRFAKIEFTEVELARALQASPLRRRLQPPAEPPLAEPPLPLAHGHIALLLSAGSLDGPVYPPGEEPHVVRGTAGKQQYLASTTVEEKDDGSTSTKRIYSERILLRIRAVGQDGLIRTFGDGAEAQPEEVDTDGD